MSQCTVVDLMSDASSEAVGVVADNDEGGTYDTDDGRVVVGREVEQGFMGIHREAGSGVFSRGQGGVGTRTPEERGYNLVSWLPRSPIWVSRAGCSGLDHSKPTSMNSSTRRESLSRWLGLMKLEGR